MALNFFLDSLSYQLLLFLRIQLYSVSFEGNRFDAYPKLLIAEIEFKDSIFHYNIIRVLCEVVKDLNWFFKKPYHFLRIFLVNHQLIHTQCFTIRYLYLKTLTIKDHFYFEVFVFTRKQLQSPFELVDIQLDSRVRWCIFLSNAPHS